MFVKYSRGSKIHRWLYPRPFMPSVGLRAESEPRDYEPGSREDFDRLYRDTPKPMTNKTG